MSTSPLMLAGTGHQSLADWSAVAFVASSSSPGTWQAYATQLRLWFQWCRDHGLGPLTEVRRPHVELYARDLEARGLAPATVALKLVVLTGWSATASRNSCSSTRPRSTFAGRRSRRSPPLSVSIAPNEERSWCRRDCPAATITCSRACSCSTPCASPRPATPISAIGTGQRPPHAADRGQRQPACAHTDRPTDHPCDRHRGRRTHRRTVVGATGREPPRPSRGRSDRPPPREARRHRQADLAPLASPCHQHSCARCRLQPARRAGLRQTRRPSTDPQVRPRPRRPRLQPHLHRRDLRGRSHRRPLTRVSRLQRPRCSPGSRASVFERQELITNHGSAPQQGRVGAVRCCCCWSAPA